MWLSRDPGTSRKMIDISQVLSPCFPVACRDPIGKLFSNCLVSRYRCWSIHWTNKTWDSDGFLGMFLARSRSESQVFVELIERIMSKRFWWKYTAIWLPDRWADCVPDIPEVSRRNYQDLLQQTLLSQLASFPSFLAQIICHLRKGNYLEIWIGISKYCC